MGILNVTSNLMSNGRKWDVYNFIEPRSVFFFTESGTNSEFLSPANKSKITAVQNFIFKIYTVRLGEQ